MKYYRNLSNAWQRKKSHDKHHPHEEEEEEEVDFSKEIEVEKTFNKEGGALKVMINHLLNVIIIKGMDILHKNVEKR